jgi:PBSX family phage portal protein
MEPGRRAPLHFDAISRLHDASDVLISAIAPWRSTRGFGIQFHPARGTIAPENADAAKAEQERLELWFQYASAQAVSFTDLLRRTVVDYELYGDGYWEMLVNAKGALVGIEPMRAYTMRKGPADRKPLEAERWVRTPEGTWKRVKYWRRFRRFLQWVDGQYTWFKEWGDPRPIRWDTGAIDPNAKPDQLASAVLNFVQYAPDHVYGKPRWRGAATAISGRTKAGEINNDTFDHKGIPPLAILVSGAGLSAGVLQRIKDHFSSTKGRENWHAPLVIEAESAAVSGAAAMDGLTGTPVKLDIKNLSEAIQKDALFSQYRKEASQDVAMSFRVPPIYLGLSSDYNRATADAAKLVAEEQTFAPPRTQFEEIINREIVPELGAVHFKVRIRGAAVFSEETLAAFIRVGIDAGALTPEHVAKVLEPFFGIELGRTEDWAKIPSSILAALVKAGWTPEGFKGLEAPEKPAPVSLPGQGTNASSPPAPTDAGVQTDGGAGSDTAATDGSSGASG